ncbi:hypothetical protein [Pseudonocardia nigra]|nr:hypothetical protein [Pseudonocardia nigra]
MAIPLRELIMRSGITLSQLQTTKSRISLQRLAQKQQQLVMPPPV